MIRVPKKLTLKTLNNKKFFVVQNSNDSAYKETYAFKRKSDLENFLADYTNKTDSFKYIGWLDYSEIPTRTPYEKSSLLNQIKR